MTILRRKHGGITSLRRKHGGTTSLRRKHSGITSLRRKYGGITSLRRKHSGITSLRRKHSGITSLRRKHSGIALLRADIHSYTNLYEAKGWKTKPNHTRNRQLLHERTQNLMAEQWATSDTLYYLAQRVCNGVGPSCWPSLCHCSPPSLDPVSKILHSIVTAVCMQGT